jgi:hypothetical protein
MTRVKINLNIPTIRQISNKEWRHMNDHTIKVWHFERTDNGVKPVEGKYDPDNPNHIPVSKVIRCHP